MALAAHVTKSDATTFFIDENCLPQTIAVARTRAEPLGWTISVGDPFKDLKTEEVFGALFQYPGVTGVCHDFSEVIASLHDAKAIAVVAADPLALTLLNHRVRWAPTSPWAPCSVSACPWVVAVRTPAILRSRTPTSAHSRAAGWRVG